MSLVSFSAKEQRCQDTFLKLGKVFNVCSGENHVLICRNESDFKACINLLALSVSFFPEIKLIAFQIMSNHFHFMFSAPSEEVIVKCLNLFINLMNKREENFANKGQILTVEFKFIPVHDLKYARNLIAYIHRNSFMVNPDVNPFSYSWGTNQYYFNDCFSNLITHVWKKTTEKWRRTMSHRKIFDEVENIFLINDYASPLCFCDIQLGMGLFRDSRQYCYALTKNVELLAEVARDLGEKVTLNDEEIFPVTKNLAKSRYGAESINLLSDKEKMEIAKVLKYDYNATTRQLHRMLGIASETLGAVFGE